MNEASTAWDPGLVQTWLERRCAAARLDQVAADRRGYEARSDYDDAAAEEWVCRALLASGRVDDRVAFAAHIKMLLGQDDFPITGIYDDRRFERSVRAHLRTIAKMTKANDGFANTLRYKAR
ncbi:hypothetical protein [Sphingomonas sp. 8AM]|uniref:hypothetical protein n=1 Tax=Sphingomonas sp. 8AM TaxID=2653170 RepID=UPI0012F000C3|nr:hypothetical protein [Sphingomonas sp. 8AM]VXC99355.1 conserved hypothetical protein [Sphingomonas sp. 8AM]